MAGRVYLKVPKFGMAIVTLAIGVVLLSDPVRSDALLDVWRSAFAPHDTITGAARPAPAPKIALGEKLFRDPRLSGNGNRACISCHKPELGFTDGLVRARALPGIQIILRNTPTLYNLATAQVFNWDGSAHSVEQQALGPIQNPGELAGTFSDIVTRLEKDNVVTQAFSRAFPTKPKISQDTITKALASYVRSLRSPKTVFDAWIAGDKTALSARQRSGFQVFVGKGGCVACHAGPRFTDEGFYDIGLPDEQVFNGQDVAGKRGVRAFKTPTLRAVSKTAPYMHNGSLKTLADVVNHYTNGIVRRRGVSGVLPPKIDLSHEEKADLVRFLETL